ncbi:DUF1015 domain-containing protein [Pseudobutyrivibrio xylanivorans]|uniref:Uncharacterized conserved protein, DUF1015 family n=1 Tax=Pseudobutyrivibrio xylanivorans TaxID=185007 RepID=A0A1G5S1I1_PSEXY|nr:DUF1015 family protein [Pseudobutyrivibrio xylanivorans]SCZ80245.1 Uncharacterized conserved protein, DUF1015 family [Pseudobutyrivibrio xylanivorans]
MALIVPFKAIRPTKEEAATIAALPYDVYSRKEAYEKVKEQPGSFLAIDRPETQFAEDVDMYSDAVYNKAAEMLNQWISDGRFIQDTDDFYYVYELTMDGRSQTGIVACASIDDYQNSVIKKHENTRAEKEQDRIRHVDTCSAQTGPIFLAYKADSTISGVVSKIKSRQPQYDFTAEDGIRHRCWVIDKMMDKALIATAFDKMNSIYIADGHHRAASAVKVGLKRREDNPGYTGKEDFNFFLSVLFPDEELKIYDYNRVVKDLNGLAPEELLEELDSIVDIVETSESPIRPAKKGQWSMLLEETWYLCQVKPELMVDDPVEGLDVSLLQNLVLEPLFGIQDPKTDDRIDFVGGIRGLEELERRCNSDCKIAFAMYPTSIQELFDVADAGLLMPPKSTWFEPKLRSGLFIHKI